MSVDIMTHVIHCASIIICQVYVSGEIVKWRGKTQKTIEEESSHTYCLRICSRTRATSPNILVDRYDLIGNSIINNWRVSMLWTKAERWGCIGSINFKNWNAELYNGQPVGDVCPSRSSGICPHNYPTIKSYCHNCSLFRHEMIYNVGEKTW